MTLPPYSPYILYLLLRILLRISCLLGSILGHLLLPSNSSLDTDTAKDETHTHPLHACEAVAKGDDGQDHGEHFPGHGYGDEQDRAECR